VLWYDTKISKVQVTSIFRVKGWYPSTTLHGVTTQKTSTWNMTYLQCNYTARYFNIASDSDCVS